MTKRVSIQSQISPKLEHPNCSFRQFSQIRNTSRNPKHFSKPETLLANRNSSHKPKHFSPPPGFEPGPHCTAVHCFIHQATGYFLLYEVKKSKFKSLIIIRYLEIRVMKLGVMRQLGNICVTMSRGRKLVGIIGVCYKPAQS